MEGGIAILLLLILVAVIGAAMLGLFGTGGALSLRRRGDAKRESRERPTHSRQTTPYHENTTFVGVDERAGPVRSDERPARGIANSVTPARRGGTMSGKAALIVIDMLNPYDHEDADVLADDVARIVPALAHLVTAAAPTSSSTSTTTTTTSPRHARGHRAARAGRPPPRPGRADRAARRGRLPAQGAPQRLLQTGLDHLLRARGVERIVLTGQVAEQCILYTALDAYIRGYEIRVARDAVAHIDEDLGRAALQMMERNMRVELVTIREVERALA